MGKPTKFLELVSNQIFFMALDLISYSKNSVLMMQPDSGESHFIFQKDPKSDTLIDSHTLANVPEQYRFWFANQLEKYGYKLETIKIDNTDYDLMTRIQRHRGQLYYRSRLASNADTPFILLSTGSAFKSELELYQYVSLNKNNLQWLPTNLKS